MNAGKKLPLILGLVNAVVALAAVGFLFYSKFSFKRPSITEAAERSRLAAAEAGPPPAPTAALLTFDPITVNIQANPPVPKAADGTALQIKGKLHYATVGFSLEVRDQNHKEEVDQLRPILIDKLISLLGRKSFQELTTVQGRYVLRAQILELANRLLAEHAPAAAAEANAAPKEAWVDNVFFIQFVVQ